MVAELSHAEGDRAALSFAGGCLSAAIRERVCDFDTRFVAGLWSIAVVTALFAAIRLACAARGAQVLLGAPDGMHDALLRHGAGAALLAGYQAARPIVVLCFLALGCAQLIAAWSLSRGQFQRFLIAWSAGLFIAGVAVIVQLSIVWSVEGVPSEFHALLVQAVAVPALLAWSRGRHRRSWRLR